MISFPTPAIPAGVAGRYYHKQITISRNLHPGACRLVWLAGIIVNICINFNTSFPHPDSTQVEMRTGDISVLFFDSLIVIHLFHKTVLWDRLFFSSLIIFSHVQLQAVYIKMRIWNQTSNIQMFRIHPITPNKIYVCLCLEGGTVPPVPLFLIEYQHETTKHLHCIKGWASFQV
jgi:hypothetical protein